jgi:hypothetical protein
MEEEGKDNRVLAVLLYVVGIVLIIFGGFLALLSLSASMSPGSDILISEESEIFGILMGMTVIALGLLSIWAGRRKWNEGTFNKNFKWVLVAVFFVIMIIIGILSLTID